MKLKDNVGTRLKGYIWDMNRFRLEIRRCVIIRAVEQSSSASSGVKKPNWFQDGT